MWVYILIGVLLLYALYKERQALGCPEVPIGECNNKEGKAVLGTSPHPEDSVEDLLSKIFSGACYQDRFVYWRVALFDSFLFAVISWFILYRRFPSEWELSVLLVVGVSVLYITKGFYKFHLDDHVKENLQVSVEFLKQRLSR